jgi:NAD+ diphosphatase
MDGVRFTRSVELDAVPSEDAGWLVFGNERLLLTHDQDGYRLPDSASLRASGIVPDQTVLLGRLGDRPYFAAVVAASELPSSLELVELRQTYGALPQLEYVLAGLAAQITHWDRTTRFCPACGTATEPMPTERAKKCPVCGFTQYPRVSPAMIVLVHRPGQILLTRQPTWPPNRYSLIAGFVEAGESLEECVHREIAEEVGVRVDAIRYLGSQAWPYPHQLMLGFTARYAGGDIALEEQELEDAKWFDLDALPDLSPPLSISRQILDWHLRSQMEPDVPFPITWYPAR